MSSGRCILSYLVDCSDCMSNSLPAWTVHSKSDFLTSTANQIGPLPGQYEKEKVGDISAVKWKRDTIRLSTLLELMLYNSSNRITAVSIFYSINDYTGKISNLESLVIMCPIFLPNDRLFHMHTKCQLCIPIYMQCSSWLFSSYSFLHLTVPERW